MKKFLLLFLLVFGTQFVQAQDLVWHTNVKEAIKISEKQKKPLMLFFTGSDWCGWCIRLQKEVLKTPEFQKFNYLNYLLSRSIVFLYLFLFPLFFLQKYVFGHRFF